MEPLPEGRGDIGVVTLSRRPLHAAMEPLPEGRGDLGEAIKTLVESYSPQWSLSPKGEETTSPSPPVGRRSTSRNGASPRRERRHGQPSRVPRLVRAAMEPLPEGRGDPPFGQCVRRVQSLPQWSLSPKGEETRVGHQVVVVGAVAAMEPLPEGRGDGPTTADIVRHPLAAMEPLPEGRGDEDRTDRRAAELEAAMEPLPEGRGDLGGPDLWTDADREPQWSLSPKGEETRQAGRPADRDRPAAMEPLPEGRGDPAAARSPPARTGSSRNGASPRRERRLRPAVDGAANDPAAMEPLPEGRGDPILGGLLQHRGGVAAMEPLPEGRGDVAGVVQQQAVHVGAAMEPLPEGRGDTGGMLQAGTHLVTPQWSLSPKGEETSLNGPPRTCAARRNGASPRRERRRVEGGRRKRRVRAAAMEPLPEGRGDRRERPEHGRLVWAAMEPLPEGRGDRSRGTPPLTCVNEARFERCRCRATLLPACGVVKHRMVSLTCGRALRRPSD